MESRGLWSPAPHSTAPACAWWSSQSPDADRLTPVVVGFHVALVGLDLDPEHGAGRVAVATEVMRHVGRRVADGAVERPLHAGEPFLGRHGPARLTHADGVQRGVGEAVAARVVSVLQLVHEHLADRLALKRKR